MLRFLALLCSLALMLAPLGQAQANPACAMLAMSQDAVHTAQGSDHQLPIAGHAGQVCKQVCAMVGILTPPDPDLTHFATIRPAPRPISRLLDSHPPAPSERPPKHLV